MPRTPLDRRLDSRAGALVTAVPTGSLLPRNGVLILMDSEKGSYKFNFKNGVLKELHRLATGIDGLKPKGILNLYSCPELQSGV
jgi:hypothetical protein